MREMTRSMFGALIGLAFATSGVFVAHEADALVFCAKTRNPSKIKVRGDACKPGKETEVSVAGGGAAGVAYTTGTSLETTSSTTYADIPGASMFASTQADGRLLITFSTETECTTTMSLQDLCQVRVLVDGVEADPGQVIYETARFLGSSMASGWASHSHQFVSDPLGAGQHTVAVQFRTTDATTLFGVNMWTLTALPLAP